MVVTLCLWKTQLSTLGRFQGESVGAVVDFSLAIKNNVVTLNNIAIHVSVNSMVEWNFQMINWRLYFHTYSNYHLNVIRFHVSAPAHQRQIVTILIQPFEQFTGPDRATELKEVDQQKTTPSFSPSKKKEKSRAQESIFYLQVASNRF